MKRKRNLDESGLISYAFCPSSKALLAPRLAGVAPEVNLRNLLCVGDEACNGSIVVLKRRCRCHQKSKTGLSVVPQKKIVSSNLKK